MYCLHFVYSLVTLFTVIAHSFCIVKLLIYCINNLHMYRTLCQAGMFKTALKKKRLLPRVSARGIEQVEKLGGAARQGAAGVSESVGNNGGRLF